MRAAVPRSRPTQGPARRPDSETAGDGGTGSASVTAIDSGGVQYVGAGSDTIGTVVSTTISGGSQFVGDFYGSGTATSTTIESGGTQYVGYLFATGTASDTTIS